MPSDEHFIQPIERLKWEHARILYEVGRLCHTAGNTPDESHGMESKIAAVFRFLELHQKAEERFRLPLVSRLDDGSFDGIRRQHFDFLRSSDALLTTGTSDNRGTRASLLTVLKEELERHFMLQEKRIFDGSAGILLPAQADILRIKFASCEGFDL